MVDAGAFRDQRLELLDGQIVEKMTQNAPHFGAIRLVATLFEQRLSGGYEVRQQGPLALSDTSQPEPDLAIVRGDFREYLQRLPGPEDVELLIEVSDTTLRDDRQIKAELYAQAGIREYWIVDLNGRGLFVHRDPSPDGYRLIQMHQGGHTLSPLFAPELSLFVSDLLP